MSTTTTTTNVNADSIKLQVDIQPTVQQSVIALLRGVSFLCDHGRGEEFSKSFAADQKGWADAVLANTSLAVETASLVVPNVEMKVPMMAPAAPAADAHASASHVGGASRHS